MGEAALIVLSGTLLYAGAHHLYLGTTRTALQPHAPLAAMYLLLAVFVLTSAFLLQPQETSTPVNIASLSMSMGILLWVALIWYVAFHSRWKPLLLLDVLTAAWIILLIRNINSPYGLLSADTGNWCTAVELTALVSLLFCFYASFRLLKRGNRQAALALWCGLSVLLASSLADHLLRTPFAQALYLAPFGFIGFLLINSVYPIVLNYRNSRKTSRTPVIYSLTFDHGRTSFGSTLADLQFLPGEKPDVTPVPAVDATTTTFSPGGELNDHQAGQGESPSGERRCPGVQGESPSGERGARGKENPRRRVAMDILASEADTQAGTADNNPEETGKNSPCQDAPVSMSKRDLADLSTVSDNLIDIAVYATMALNRYKRGDADPQVQESLCEKIRRKAIKTRRLANKLSRPGKTGSEV